MQRFVKAESMLLGWCLYSPRTFGDVIKLHPELSEKHFASEMCGALFTCARQFFLDNGGKGVDRLKVAEMTAEKLGDKYGAESIKSYFELFESQYLEGRKIVPADKAASYWSDRLLESYLNRRVSKLGQGLKDIAHDGKSDVLSRSMALLNEFESEQNLDTDKIVPLKALFDSMINDFINNVSRFVQPTGFAQLDDLLKGGYYEGTMNLIAGRPGAGKTALALDIAGNIARDQNKRGTVVVYSLEMTNRNVIERLVTYFSGCDLKMLNTHPEALFKVMNEFVKAGYQTIDQDPGSPLGMAFSDRSNVTVETMRAELTSIKSKVGLAAVVVDYIGLMHAPGRFENRNIELGQISFGLRSIAKDLQVPFIVVAQMNRQGEGESAVPKASFLRDSGSLEQDADTIIMLTPLEQDDKDGDKPVNLHIVKNRFNTVTGCRPLRLKFNGGTNTFVEEGRIDLPKEDKRGNR